MDIDGDALRDRISPERTIELTAAIVTIIGFASGYILYIYEYADGFLIALIVIFLMFLTNTVETLVRWKMTENKEDIASGKLPDQLLQIMNRSVRGPTMTRIEKFLSDAGEAELESGDEVMILTHDLQGYDMTEPALDTISKNISNNVKYKYFLPVNGYPALEEHRDNLRYRIMERVESPELVDENLIFYSIEDRWIYNFAVIYSRKDGQDGYWYTTTSEDVETTSQTTEDVETPTELGGHPPRNQREGGNSLNLAIYALDAMMSERLYEFFMELEKMAVEEG